MLKRLPRWIWIGAWVLAFLAGMVNVVGLLGFEHQALTHMTGLTSKLAVSLVEGNPHDALHVLAVMVSFVGGAVLSGMLIQDRALYWGQRYGLALLIEAILLLGATFLAVRNHAAGFYMASFACGLQNAMAANLSGSAIRTTHVSGMFSDLGAYIGHRLRGAEVDVLRIRICLSTITGFAAGGAAGVLLFKRIGAYTLLVPATIALALGLTYGLIRRLGSEPGADLASDLLPARPVENAPPNAAR